MDINVQLAEQPNKVTESVEEQSICPRVNALSAFSPLKRRDERKYKKE